METKETNASRNENSSHGNKSDFAATIVKRTIKSIIRAMLKKMKKFKIYIEI